MMLRIWFLVVAFCVGCTGASTTGDGALDAGADGHGDTVEASKEASIEASTEAGDAARTRDAAAPPDAAAPREAGPREGGRPLEAGVEPPAAARRIGVIQAGDSVSVSRDSDPTGQDLFGPATARSRLAQFARLSAWDAAVSESWGPLRPVTGAANGVTLTRHGPEATMARYLEAHDIAADVVKYGVGSTNLRQWLEGSLLDQCLDFAEEQFALVGAPDVAAFVYFEGVWETTSDAEVALIPDRLDELEKRVRTRFPLARIIVLGQAPALYHNLSRGPKTRQRVIDWVAADSNNRRLLGEEWDRAVEAVTDNHPETGPTQRGGELEGESIMELIR